MKQAQNFSKHKIILVGDGAVGSSFAYSLVTQSVGRELGIIDVNHDKAVGDALDLSNAVPFYSPKYIYAAEYADCVDADIVVLCAGAAQKPGETRLDLVHKNLKIYQDIVGQVVDSGFAGIFLVAANPVDILTYATWKFSGFPAERVIGSGTSLDTSRLRQEVATLVGVDARNVHGYILGEHGDTEFPVWSHANIGGLQINEWLKIDDNTTEEALDRVFVKVRDAAYEIISRKGATYYGIASALTRICQAIFEDQKAILPLSVYLDGQFGQEDVFIGAPAIIGRQGIERIIEIPLNDLETEQMNHSASTLKQVIHDGFARLDN